MLVNLNINNELTGRSCIQPLKSEDSMLHNSSPVLAARASAPAAIEYSEPQWYAAYTCARHEKRVAKMLDQKSVELFLPLREAVHRWKNGRAKVQLPLFPGYVFVHIALKDRLQVLEVPSVVRLVGFNGRPTPLPEAEMESIRLCLASGQHVEPHPYLTVGRRVLVKSGPLQGLEGILVRKKGNLRVVISIDLIGRSIIADIDAAEVEPQN